MKKLLGLLAALGLTASAGSAAVACGPVEKTAVEKVTAQIKDLTASSKTTPFADQAAAEEAVTKLATETVSVEILAEAATGSFELVLTIVKGEETEEITLHVLVKEIEAPVETKTALNTLITVLAIGEFTEAPKAADVLTNTTTANATFTAAMHAEVDVVVSATSATITAKEGSTTLEGTVTVTFTVAPEETK